MLNSEIIKEVSHGVFPIRFNGYMNGAQTKIHQQAYLVYNKKGVPRQLALRRLNEINLKPEPQIHASIPADINNDQLWPMLNFINYGPYEGGNYSNPNFISINKLKACIGMNCEDKKHGKY